MVRTTPQQGDNGGGLTAKRRGDLRSKDVAWFGDHATAKDRVRTDHYLQTHFIVGSVFVKCLYQYMSRVIYEKPFSNV